MSNVLNVDKMKVLNTLIGDEVGEGFMNKREYTYINLKGDECKSVSLIPYYPLRDKVIIRNKFVIPRIQMAGLKIDNFIKTAKVSSVVVGIGDEVRGIELGDTVHVGYSAIIESIDFPNNEKSLIKIMELYNANTSCMNNVDSSKSSIIAYEYYTVPASAIHGIKL
ncbi:hypothetical protein DSECCO2_120330 [anaerobic digester metagenome]